MADTRRKGQGPAAKRPPPKFSIKVGHLDIEVVGWTDHEADSNDADGMYDPKAEKIFIRQSATPVEQLRIFLHEINHCIWDTWGMDDYGPINQEGVCHRMSLGLVNVLRDNPGLLGVIQKVLEGGHGFFPATVARSTCKAAPGRLRSSHD